MRAIGQNTALQLIIFKKCFMLDLHIEYTVDFELELKNKEMIFWGFK
jgi:hypothetical protein